MKIIATIALALPLAAASAQPQVTAADLQPLEELRKSAAATLGITNAPRFDLDLIAKNVNALRLHPYMDNGWAKNVKLPSFENVKLSPADMAEIVDLGIKAADIFVRVNARQEAHRRALAARGVAASTRSAIVPIPVGDETAAVRASERLLAEGVWIPAIRYPTVARGAARLRASVMSAHTREDLAFAAAAIARALR